MVFIVFLFLSDIEENAFYFFQSDMIFGFVLLLLVSILISVIGFISISRKIGDRHLIKLEKQEIDIDNLVSKISFEILNQKLVGDPKIIYKKKNGDQRKIPTKIVTAILKKLAVFEKKQGYLNPELKLTKLAEEFETNTKYLSKVILKEKRVPYKTYIRRLKLKHAKDRMDSEYRFRRYKIEVIAKESGFKTAESFSKAFLKTYGLYPSKYIKKVEKKTLSKPLSSI